MQEDEELVVVGCADGREWPMQEVQAPSWEVQVSICARTGPSPCKQHRWRSQAPPGRRQVTNCAIGSVRDHLLQQAQLRGALL